MPPITETIEEIEPVIEQLATTMFAEPAAVCFSNVDVVDRIFHHRQNKLM